MRRVGILQLFVITWSRAWDIWNFFQLFGHITENICVNIFRAPKHFGSFTTTSHRVPVVIFVGGLIISKRSCPKLRQFIQFEDASCRPYKTVSQEDNVFVLYAEHFVSNIVCDASDVCLKITQASMCEILISLFLQNKQIKVYLP